jgi:hypothetical protein
MVMIEGLAVEGSAVKGMKNRKFVVLSARYEDVKDLDNETKTKRKLILSISLNENKAVLDYFPNKTSIKRLIAKHGMETDLWIEKQEEFKVLQMMIGSDEKDVLYIM